jgi:hypothetical protein
VQITTTASTYPLAAQYANALAVAFLAVQANVQGQNLEVQIAEYCRRMKPLQQQLATVTTQIDNLLTGPPSPKVHTQVLALTGLQSAYQTELSRLTTQINTDQASLTTLKSGNVVVDKATPA